MKYPSIRIEGAILSPELFERADDLPGQRPADFGLPTGAAVKDDIARAWADAQDYWRIFQRKLGSLNPNASATTETRNLWIVPLLGLLGYQLERQERGVDLNAKNYPISHRAPNRAGLPVHIVSFRDPAGLDRKPERASGPRMSAHGLVQEYLNLADQTYGLVTSGRLLRLLRDSSRLVKLTYLEWDLERIFTDGLYADFALLYRFLHASRLPASSEHGTESLIERYHLDSIAAGARIRDGLSYAVEHAIKDLANGLLNHPKNDTLRAAVQQGTLTAPAFYKNTLRLIYRLLFLLVIEERKLVYPPNAAPAQRDLYHRYYSLQRLRGLAANHHLHERRHDDAWFAVLACFRLFETDGPGPRIGIAPLAGQLFRPDAIGLIRDCHLDNATLLATLDRLCTFQHPDTGQHTTVNYGALDSEEFGSVYERLLELHPVFLKDDKVSFSFKQAAGNERKTTGSYYTPSSLVECLLDSALEPVVAQRLAGKKGADAEQAILTLRVCDPACGSGHFLIAAAHRLARHLALLRSNDEEPSPAEHRHAVREVISHCIYGVDANPMAVELCKVTLWLEAMEPGKPLSFLDHHIQCGNSLLGATPRVLAEGLPDDAFKPISGDDKTICAEAKKRNKSERQQLALFHGTETVPWERLGNLPAAMIELETMTDDTAAAVQRKEQRYAELVQSTGYLHSRFLADAWCAAFVWKKTRDFPYPITNDILRKIERNPHDCAPWMREEVERLRDQYQFFHWHLAFPEIFPLPVTDDKPDNEHTGWNGGFDVMLGNPPWERVKLQEKEWFAERRPEIAEAPNAAARKRLIEKLAVENPTLHTAFGDAVRQAEGESHVLRDSELFPLCGCGDVNLYAVFAEAMRQHLASTGRMGAVLPSGIATDDTTKLFFQNVCDTRSLVSLFDFENRAGLFPAVDSRMKFCLFTAGNGVVPATDAAEFVFFAHRVEELRDSERRFTLSADDIKLLNPNSRTCPIFRSQRDAELTKSIYRRVPVLMDEVRAAQQGGNPWGFDYMTKMFDMADSSHEFVDLSVISDAGWQRYGLDFADPNGTHYTPLYEAKHIHHFDHRWHSGANSAESVDNRVTNRDSNASLVTRYWVLRSRVDDRLASKQWSKQWLLGWRDITNTTNERTCLLTVFPRTAVAHTLRVAFVVGTAPEAATFQACLSSLGFDYVTRQKVGGTHLTVETLKQLPVLLSETYTKPCAWATESAVTLRDWLLSRVLELTYTAWDLEPFAQDCGWSGPPFIWDEARRFQLRCELDAAFFHLYGLNRDDTAYILDTFPIVRRKDIAATEVKDASGKIIQEGTYRTKDTILALYDQFAEHQRTGTAFVSPLSRPPASFLAAHRWSWRELPMEVPTTHREPLPYAFQYTVTVMIELVLQAGGSLSWSTLRAATDLLTDRRNLAQCAEPFFGTVARDWLALNGDCFDASDRFDQLSGLCFAGRMCVGRNDFEPVVKLLTLDQHVYFPHIRFDARLALAVAQARPKAFTQEGVEHETRRVEALITV